MTPTTNSLPWREVAVPVLIAAFIVGSVMLSGCSSAAGVVTTEIEVNKTDGTVRVSSPKNVTLEGLDIVTNADGSRSVKVAKYASTADPAALEAVKSQYAAIQSAGALAIEVAKAAK